MFSLEKVINSKLNGLEYSVILDSGVTKLGGLVTSINFATPFSPRKMRSVEYMSEVFICRGGSGSGSGKPYPGAEKVLRSIFINTNTVWEVPNGIINNQIEVTLAGGGGSGYPGNAGGGGGWMNNGTVKLSSGEKINVTIGIGGNGEHRTGTPGNGGGTTSFGTYISAAGGSSGYYDTDILGYVGGDGASGGGSNYAVRGGIGYLFGGGGCLGYGGRYGNGRGGPGGVWGGGGGGKMGGQGGYYGGGGSSAYYDSYYGVPGDGGYYGGGGGTAASGIGGKGGYYLDNGTWKSSGFGGNGGGSRVKAEDGTNTIGWINVMKDENGNYITGA